MWTPRSPTIERERAATLVASLPALASSPEPSPFVYHVDGDAALELVRALESVRDVSLTVHAGEILGVAGVAGNGQRELAEAITGIRPATTGQVRGFRRPLRPGPGRRHAVRPDGAARGAGRADRAPLGVAARAHPSGQPSGR